jgi:hypothetical protein
LVSQSCVTRRQTVGNSYRERQETHGRLVDFKFAEVHARSTDQVQVHVTRVR